MEDLYVWIVEDGKLSLWRRTGECLKCGRCCCGSTINFTSSIWAIDKTDEQEHEPEVEEDDDWSDWKDYAILEAQGVWWYFRINSIEGDDRRCGSLDEDGLCGCWQDWKKFRPVCRYWPFHPLWAHHYPGCGFSFERVDAAQAVGSDD